MRSFEFPAAATIRRSLGRRVFWDVSWELWRNGFIVAATSPLRGSLEASLKRSASLAGLGGEGTGSQDQGGSTCCVGVPEESWAMGAAVAMGVAVAIQVGILEFFDVLESGPQKL